MAAIVLAVCAMVVAAVAVVRPDGEPGLEVETAKPPVAEVGPASRGIEAPATTSTTVGPSTTTTSSVPISQAPTSTSTTLRRRPPTTSSTVTTSKVTTSAPTTTATAPATNDPVALDRPGFYIAKLDGSGLRRVSTDVVGTMPFQPAVSPDGRRLAYVGAGTDVYIMDLTTGTKRRLGGPVATGRAGGAPVWSPDSKLVAFPGAGGTSPPSRDVWIADAAGVEPIRVISHPGDDSVVAWGPDGRLASTSEDGIAVYRPDGSGRTIIYPKPMGDPGLLRWSPDGTMVAAIPGGWYVSVIAKADGSGSTELHHYYSGHGLTGDFSATEVDWAPSSDRLVLAGRSRDPERAPAWRVIKADGTAMWTQPATPWPSPDWAPAGEVIASLRDGNIQLYDAHTGAHTRSFMSMPTGLAVTNYTWMSDGTAIAFSAGPG